jgi:hypothetical protein
MAIPEETVAAIVGEVSAKLSDPEFAQVMIGSFAEAHPDASRFIAAQVKELGGEANVVHTVFHAQVISECFASHARGPLPPVRFADLNTAAQGDPMLTVQAAEPAISSYIGSNVEGRAMARLLAMVGIALSKAVNLL